MHEIPSPSNIFLDNSPLYYSHGLQVIPLYEREKRPCINDWSKFATEVVSHEVIAEWHSNFPRANMGLALGPASGVLMIDIDTQDPRLMEVITSVLPPSPWVRKGKKGMMLAFKYSPIKTHRIKNVSGEMIVECLAARTQCVLPPSIHPDTLQPYEANIELWKVLEQLVPLPEDIEETLRQALIGAGVTLSHSGWSKVTDFVASGARDTTLTEFAGLFAFAVTRGERTLKEAIGMLRSYYAEFIENSAGDAIDIEKHVSNLVKFLHRDVLDKGKVLPKGWDAGLSDKDKENLGITLSTEHTEWTFQEITDYLRDQFELHDKGKARADVVEAILLRIAKSPSLTRIDEDRILKYIVEVSSQGVSMATYRARLKELRQGDVAGNDHSEIAQATLKDLEQYNKIAYVGEKFMKWAGSHWVKMPNTHILNHISTHYGHLNATKKHNDIQGVLKTLSFICPQEIKKQHMTGVNFANGFLTTELKLIPHNPDLGMTYTLPFRYMPEQAGQFPRFQKFLTQCWGRDDDCADKLAALQEALAVTIFGLGSKFQRAFMLHGVPSSGKTQLLRIVQSMLPEEAKCSLPPDAWGDKFLTVVMHLKLLNVCGELSDKKRIDGQLFKDIIDGSERPAQFKNAQIFTMTPVLSHWFASNHLPKTEDTSSGFIRRWLFLTFHYPVKEEEKELDLGAVIAAEEREAIIAWAAQAMPRLMLNNRYTLPDSHRKLSQEFANINNSVRLFLLESGKCRFGVENGFVEEVKAFNAYWAFCAGSGGARPVGLPKFRTMMRELQDEMKFKLKVASATGGGTSAIYEGMSIS